MTFTRFITGLLVSAFYSVAAAQGSTKASLFNGENFDGWEIIGGNAEYIIEGDAIVGITKMDTPNTFLTTKKKYSDFILEFETKIEGAVNSGVQIRSASDPAYKSGRMHGYQVEVDPSRRGFTGGIYDEGRRRWLYPLTVNEKARQYFLPGRWNKIRVEAVGSSIRTWVNGKMAANLVDSMDASGVIGLQVHRVRDKDLVGNRISWRKLTIQTKDLENAQWPTDSGVREVSYLHNRLTKNERRKGFRLLWDGKSSKGWRGAKTDRFPKSGWKMKDGVLTVEATDGGESTGPGDIVTTDVFGNFELELQFKITKGANSGIKYFVDTNINKGAGSAIGLEFQILDDEHHPDAMLGVAGNRRLGSAYDLIAAEGDFQGIERTSKGIGEWNLARVVARDGQVEHWLNNEKIVEFDRYSQMFDALVKYSKYAKWDDFGRLPQGVILLQDHGDEVHFRSIKIREL